MTLINYFLPVSSIIGGRIKDSSIGDLVTEHITMSQVTYTAVGEVQAPAVITVEMVTEALSHLGLFPTKMN